MKRTQMKPAAQMSLLDFLEAPESLEARPVGVTLDPEPSRGSTGAGERFLDIFALAPVSEEDAIVLQIRRDRAALREGHEPATLYEERIAWNTKRIGR